LDRFAERFHLSDDEVADDATVFFLRFTEQRHRRVIHLPSSNIHSVRLTFERTLSDSNALLYSNNTIASLAVVTFADGSRIATTAPPAEGVQHYSKR